MKNTTIKLNGNTFLGQADDKFFYFNDCDKIELGLDKIEIKSGDKETIEIEHKKDNPKNLVARDKIFLPEDAELLCDGSIVVWDGKKLVFKGASVDANFFYEGQEVLFDYDGDPYVMEDPITPELPSKEPKKKPSMVKEEIEELEKKDKEPELDGIKEEIEDVEKEVEDVDEEVKDVEEEIEDVKKIEPEISDFKTKKPQDKSMETSDTVAPPIKETVKDVDRSIQELTRLKKGIK